MRRWSGTRERGIVDGMEDDNTTRPRAWERAAWAGPGARRRQADVEGTRLRWVETGDGPPLILLHGYGGSARWWQQNIGPLGAIRRVYALDIPGFGGSRMREGFRFTRVADLIARWMERLNLPPSDMVSHSMGGQLALVLAAHHPDRVRSLVVAAPAGIPFDGGLLWIARQAWRSRSSGDWRFTPIVVRGALRAGPRMLWQAVAQIRAVDVREHLEAVRAPTLILWGDRDRLLPAANGPILAAAIAGARLEVLPGAGHNIMWEQAERFNEAVAAFITRDVPRSER